MKPPDRIHIIQFELVAFTCKYLGVDFIRFFAH